MQQQQTSVFQWVMLALAVMAAWKIWKAARTVFWTAVGFAWVTYWTGGWPLRMFF
jgi:hypothetical protein